MFTTRSYEGSSQLNPSTCNHISSIMDLQKVVCNFG